MPSHRPPRHGLRRKPASGRSHALDRPLGNASMASAHACDVASRPVQPGTTSFAIEARTGVIGCELYRIQYTTA
jgi:hypothetical protein